MSLELVAYLNIIASIVIFISCAYVYLNWSRKNARFAKAFLLVGLLNLARGALGFYELSPIDNMLYSAVSSFFIVTLLSYIVYLLHPKCKIMFLLYSMFFYAVPSILSGNIFAALIIIRMICLVYLLPFFVILMLLRTGELRLIAFVVIIGITVFLSALPFSLLIDPAGLPLFIPYIFFTAAYIGFAHLSAHDPNLFMEKIEVRKKSDKK